MADRGRCWRSALLHVMHAVVHALWLVMARFVRPPPLPHTVLWSCASTLPMCARSRRHHRGLADGPGRPARRRQRVEHTVHGPCPVATSRPEGGRPPWRAPPGRRAARQVGQGLPLLAILELRTGVLHTPHAMCGRYRGVVVCEPETSPVHHGSTRRWLWSTQLLPRKPRREVLYAALRLLQFAEVRGAPRAMGEASARQLHFRIVREVQLLEVGRRSVGAGVQEGLKQDGGVVSFAGAQPKGACMLCKEHPRPGWTPSTCFTVTQQGFLRQQEGRNPEDQRLPPGFGT